MRRYPEAHDAEDRGLALAPTNLTILQYKAMTFLAEGNLSDARTALHAAEKNLDAVALVSYMASHWDTTWGLDSGQLDLLLGLSPSAFDDNKGMWARCLARGYALRGDQKKVRMYAEEAVRASEERLRADPQSAGNHTSLGLALAYVGRRTDAIREGERAVALIPVSKDAYAGALYQYWLARIYLLSGEPEKALDQLEPLLKIPFIISSAWLKIDPDFEPLHGNARFRKLVAPN
jgi:serine/threonine-protein kinase